MYGIWQIFGYKLPIRGVAFVTGSMSPTIVLNNTIASSKFTPKYIIFVPNIKFNFKIIPRDNFSPESGGSVKPRTAMEAMRRQGTMRLKK